MEAGGWKVAGVSVAGPSHSDEGSECQDAHSIALDPGGLVIAIVSDGAGSTAHGGVAARFLCEHLPPLLRKAVLVTSETPFAEPAGRQRLSRRIAAAIGLVRRRLLDLAVERAIDPDELLATLIGAIVHPSLGAILLHIGDGAAICFDGDGKMTLFSPPENGEYVNTTYFFIEDEWRFHLRLCFQAPGVDSIFLMSDGVTDLSFTRSREGLLPFQPFFEALRRFFTGCERDEGEAALAASLGGEPARSKVDDDKTLVWIGARASNG
jgi:hypothetical protein